MRADPKIQECTEAAGSSPVGGPRPSKFTWRNTVGAPGAPGYWMTPGGRFSHGRP